MPQVVIIGGGFAVSPNNPASYFAFLKLNFLGRDPFLLFA
jgi:hypothetical protein